jgi:exodeoxyribonuclease V alpha subunit
MLHTGQPVMITRNDYNLQLFNGDVGIVFPDPESHNQHRVYFANDSGEIRKIIPTMLPAYETVYAMTVHKSQGSEFDNVLLILPNRDSPVLTRELLYTAITRARYKVEIWGKKDVFRSAVGKQILRESGLNEILWAE